MKISESSILLDPDFQKDFELIFNAFEEGFHSEYVKDVVSASNKIYNEIQKFIPSVNHLRSLILQNKINKEVMQFYVKHIEYDLPVEAIFKQNFKLSKGTVNLAISIKKSKETLGYFGQLSNTIGIVIPRNVDPVKFFTKNKEAIKNTIIHEVTHRYKLEYRKEIRRKKQKFFTVGGADYALYDEERESHLSEIWREMETCYNTGKKTKFEDCLYDSSTFLMIINSMGGFTEKNKIKPEDFQKLPKKYQLLYKYFLKKLLEKWSSSGYWKDEARGSFSNLDKPIVNNSTKKSFFKKLLNKFLF